MLSTPDEEDLNESEEESFLENDVCLPCFSREWQNSKIHALVLLTTGGALCGVVVGSFLLSIILAIESKDDKAPSSLNTAAFSLLGVGTGLSFASSFLFGYGTKPKLKEQPKNEMSLLIQKP